MRDKSIVCSACGKTFGMSSFWWTLELRSWLHDRLAGRDHRAEVRRIQRVIREEAEARAEREREAAFAGRARETINAWLLHDRGVVGFDRALHVLDHIAHGKTLDSYGMPNE